MPIIPARQAYLDILKEKLPAEAQTWKQQSGSIDARARLHMEAIVALDTKTSSFFDHRDPAVVKRLGEVKLTT
jgi:hypothetical protein